VLNGAWSFISLLRDKLEPLVKPQFINEEECLVHEFIIQFLIELLLNQLLLFLQREILAFLAADQIFIHLLLLLGRYFALHLLLNDLHHLFWGRRTTSSRLLFTLHIFSELLPLRVMLSVDGAWD